MIFEESRDIYIDTFRHEKGFKQPKKPNEQWHTDFSYIRIGTKFYYFSAVLDGYSRKILVWDLFDDMKEYNVELLITKTKELHPDAKPRIIHDNGKQYVANEFKNFLPCLELLIQRQGLFIRNQTAKLKDSTGLLKPSMFAGHRMKFSKVRWGKGLQKESKNFMMQVSNDRNTGKLKLSSRLLDHLISFSNLSKFTLG